MAESTFFQPLTMWRVLHTLGLSPGWFPSAVVMHGAAHKGFWNPFSRGMLLHTHLHIHMLMALYLTVLQMVFFIFQGFPLKFVIYAARAKYIPAVCCQQSLLTLLRSEQTQEQWTELWFSKDQMIRVQQCSVWAPVLPASILLELISSADLVRFILLVTSPSLPSHPSLSMYVRDTHEERQTTQQIYWSSSFRVLFSYLVWMKVSWTAQEMREDSVKLHYLNLPHSLCTRHELKE